MQINGVYLNFLSKNPQKKYNHFHKCNVAQLFFNVDNNKKCFLKTKSAYQNDVTHHY